MKNLILVFILFATLLAVNATPHQLYKRTTQFNACPVPNLPELSVVLVPDPLVSNQNAKFTVSGTLNNAITAGKTILGIGFADTSKNPLGEPYTQTFDKSYGAGTAFSIEADAVPVPELPKDYYIVVVVGDPTGDPSNPLDAYGCSYASV